MTRAHERLSAQLCDALREHLSRKTAPKVPEAGQVVWQAFVTLSATRAFHQFGPAPISFTEIEAWCRLTRTSLAPHHVEIIRAMDETFVEHFLSATEKTPEGVNTLPQRSRQSLSPALFDAVMG